ncbi:MAG: HNH endonuclease [Gammaproteobacteria bacterium]|nr:HNH endonuclease [Gammaproteobacteria bacterium]
MSKLSVEQCKNLHPRAVAGAASEVTNREATGDKSVTIDKYEREVLHELIKPDTIKRKGGGDDDKLEPKHEFMIWDSNTGLFSSSHVTLTYPKLNKGELRLYFNAKAKFYPKEGEQFFILRVEGDDIPYIGAMDSEAFEGKTSNDADIRSYTSGEILDMEDDAYQKAVHQPSTKASSRTSTTTTFQRNPLIARQVLSAAGFKCAVDSSHTTFTSGSHGQPYMEPHHLIPISNQAEFEEGLDCEANIIVLCPTCHRAIHYADADRKSQLVERFYVERKEQLEESGIAIGLEELLAKYGLS